MCGGDGGEDSVFGGLGRGSDGSRGDDDGVGLCEERVDGVQDDGVARKKECDRNVGGRVLYVYEGDAAFSGGSDDVRVVDDDGLVDIEGVWDRVVWGAVCHGGIVDARDGGLWAAGVASGDEGRKG